MKDENQEIKNEKPKKKINILEIAIIIVFIATLIIVVLSVTKDNNSSSKKGDTPNQEEESKTPISTADEEELKKEFGMSKDDAIALVKERYNSVEDYTFSASITEDRKYLVSVYHEALQTTNQYVVDPETKQVYAQ